MKLKVKVELEVNSSLANSATQEQLQEWIEYEIGYRCQIDNDNPLIMNPLDVTSCMIELEG